jgi:replicative DNA helicase
MANGISDRRLPPQSIEAEEAVLGGILLDNRALDRALELILPDDFYRESHRRIFRAMIDLDERREPADVITLCECLRTRGDLEAAGGVSAIAELAERAATAANVAYYAKIVKEKSILRSLVEAATDVAVRATEGTGDVDQFLEDAEKAVFAISERKIKRAFFKVEDIIAQSLDTIQSLFERPELVTGVPTGFIDLDRMTAGLQPADLVIIAGRPSMGKSALATNIAQYCAAHHGKAVALFSLEMSKEQLVLRMLCGEARVDGARVRSGYMSERDLTRLAMAAQRLADLEIYIDDTPALSILELRSKTRRLMRELGRDAKKPFGLVVVDYLQLMRAHREVDSREQEISAISRSLKALAKELDVPVIALSQLNRQVEQRADKRPAMADLRESGAIEQDADVIMFVYRDEVYNKTTTEEGVAEIIVAKQRNGPTGVVKLAFRRELTRFENLSARQEDDDAEPRDEAYPE